MRAGNPALEGALQKKSITVFPMFGEPYEVDIDEARGGHGGGDPVLLNDIFGCRSRPVQPRGFPCRRRDVQS
jgi:hypothetical protein